MGCHHTCISALLGYRQSVCDLSGVFRSECCDLFFCCKAVVLKLYCTWFLLKTKQLFFKHLPHFWRRIELGQENVNKTRMLLTRHQLMWLWLICYSPKKLVEFFLEVEMTHPWHVSEMALRRRFALKVLRSSSKSSSQWTYSFSSLYSIIESSWSCDPADFH